MKSITWIAIVLIVVSALVLAYQGINYTRQKDVVDMGSVHITKESHERIPIPSILGGVAVIGGVIMLVAGTRNKP